MEYRIIGTIIALFNINTIWFAIKTIQIQEVAPVDVYSYSDYFIYSSLIAGILGLIFGLLVIIRAKAKPIVFVVFGCICYLYFAYITLDHLFSQ